MTSPPADSPATAAYCAERGWVTVPVEGKKPLGTDWQKRSLADVRPWTSPVTTSASSSALQRELVGRRHGLRRGADRCAVPAAAHEDGARPPRQPGLAQLVRRRRGAENGALRDLRSGDNEGATLVELRGTGGQTVVPPSVHPSGESIAWVVWPPDPVRVKLADLQRAVADVAAAALLARHQPGKGSRHDFALALAGMLRHGGYPQERAELLVEAVADAVGDAEHQDRRRCVIDTYARKNGHATTGGPTLAMLVGEKVVELVRQWLDLRAVVTAEPEPWEEPVPLTTTLAPVPPFPLELLPASVRTGSQISASGHNALSSSRPRPASSRWAPPSAAVV